MSSEFAPESSKPSPSPTIVELEEPELSSVSTFRKIVLLLAFSVAEFLDILNISAIFSAIPTIAADLHMTNGESVWIISGYQLTFASFLLLSGRLSDLYNPKYLFTSGLFSLGTISLITGFVRNKIGVIVLRAFGGIAAAITIPSALNLIVHLFPKPAEQARAISVFGGVAAIGNVSGLIIGAVFVQLATWHWIFWFNSLLAIPIAVACAILIPRHRSEDSSVEPSGSKIKRLDVPGVSLLTISFVLFIYALTSGSNDGWGTANVLVPLIIAILLLAAFLYYETRIPEENAALPPKIWFYPNFSVLFGISLVPFLWWTSTFLLFTSLWQEVYGWSPLLSGVRFLPLGIISFITMMFSGYLQARFNLKRIILTGWLIVIPATLLFPFAGGKDRYWPIVFPAFFVGTLGATLVYSNTNIAMFKNTPASMAGTVGAVFNAALQIGSAIGVAAMTSIETNVEAKSEGGSSNYNGRAAGFWFLLGLVVLETVSVVIFFRDQKPQFSNEEDSTSSRSAAETLEKVDTLVVPVPAHVKSMDNDLFLA